MQDNNTTEFSMRSTFIHAHGSSEKKTVVIPHNTVVIALCEKEVFLGDATLSHNIWHLKLHEIHNSFRNWIASEAVLKESLINYLTDIMTITKLPENDTIKGNRLCAFFPCDIINDVSFDYKDYTFVTGVFKLPIKEEKLKYGTRKNDISKLTLAEYHSALHDLTHPKHERLTHLSKPLVLTLSDFLTPKYIDNSETLHLIFLMTCRVPSSKKQSVCSVQSSLSASTGIPLVHEHIPEIAENIIGVSKSLFDYEETISKPTADSLTDDFRSKLQMKCQRQRPYISNKENTKRLRINQNGNNSDMKSGGGSSRKYAYHIREEKDTRRKYIRLNNQRWYFDEHRGKYRYTDDKLRVVITGQ